LRILQRARVSPRGSSEEPSATPGLEDAPIINPSLNAKLDGYAYKADGDAAEIAFLGLLDGQVEPQPESELAVANGEAVEAAAKGVMDEAV
jgi:hypothetical protein